MGNHCSQGCVSCYMMCLFFPLFTCLICRNNHGSTGSLDGSTNGNIDGMAKDPQFSADDLLKAYNDLAAVHEPHAMCNQMHGNYHDDTKTCIISLEHPEDFLAQVSGIDTAEQLCSQVQGTFANNNCSINVGHCGQASLEVQQVACSSLGGTWTGGSCGLLN